MPRHPPSSSTSRARSLPAKVKAPARAESGAKPKRDARLAREHTSPASPPALPRSLEIANRHPRLHVPRRAVAQVIARLDAHAAEFRGGCPPGELSLVFLTDAALAQLHADFLDDPTPTDVITFEGDPAHGVAGEICVSADTAARYAQRHGRDFAAELTLYLVHGWLHLAGYDDLEPVKKRLMRRAEARAMQHLTPAGLPAFRWRP